MLLWTFRKSFLRRKARSVRVALVGGVRTGLMISRQMALLLAALRPVALRRHCHPAPQCSYREVGARYSGPFRGVPMPAIRLFPALQCRRPGIGSANGAELLSH